MDGAAENNPQILLRRLKMRYRADQEAGFHWIVNSAGQTVSAVKTDGYTRNPDLPRLDTFRLVPLPAIRD